MPLDPDRLAAAVVDVLTKTLAPVLERLAALEQRAAVVDGQLAEIATLKEALAAADRHVLGELAALRAEQVDGLATLADAIEALKSAAPPPSDDRNPPAVH